MNKTYSGHITEELFKFAPPPTDLPEETQKVVQYISSNPLKEIPQNLKPACRYFYRDIKSPWTFYIMIANGSDLDFLLSVLKGIDDQKTRYFFLRQLLVIHGPTKAISKLIIKECQALKKEKMFNGIHQPLANLLTTFNEKKETFCKQEKKLLTSTTKTLLKTLLKLEKEVLPLMPLCDKLNINFSDIGLKQPEIFQLHIKQGKEKNLISAARLCQNKEQQIVYTRLFSTLLQENSLSPKTIKNRIHWDKINPRKVIKPTIEWLKTTEKVCGITILTQLISQTPKTREYKLILDYLSTTPSDPSAKVKVLNQLSFSWRKMLRKYPTLAPILSDKKAVSIAKDKDKLVKALFMHYLNSEQYEKAFEILEEKKSSDEWREPLIKLLKGSIKEFPSAWLHHYFTLPEAVQKQMLKKHYLEIRTSISNALSQKRDDIIYADLFRFFNEKASFELSLVEKSLLICPHIDLKVAAHLFPLIKRYSKGDFRYAKGLNLAGKAKRKYLKFRNESVLAITESSISLEQVHKNTLIRFWMEILSKLDAEETLEIMVDYTDEVIKIIEDSNPQVKLFMVIRLIEILRTPSKNPEVLIKQVDACDDLSIPVTQQIAVELGSTFIKKITIPIIKLRSFDPREIAGERLLDLLGGIDAIAAKGAKIPFEEVSQALDFFLEKQGVNWNPVNFLQQLTKWNFKYYSFSKCCLYILKKSPSLFMVFLELIKQLPPLKLEITARETETIIHALEQVSFDQAVDLGIKLLTLNQVHKSLTPKERLNLLDVIIKSFKPSKKIHNATNGNFSAVKKLKKEETYYLILQGMDRLRGKENRSTFTKFYRMIIKESTPSNVGVIPILFAGRLKLAYDEKIHDQLLKQAEIYFNDCTSNMERKRFALDILLLGGMMLEQQYREKTFAKARELYRELYTKPNLSLDLDIQGEAALILNIQEHQHKGENYLKFFYLMIKKLTDCGAEQFACSLIISNLNKIAPILDQLKKITDKYSDIQLN